LKKLGHGWGDAILPKNKSQKATLIGEAGTGVLRQTPSRRFASIMLPINRLKNRGKAKLSFVESNR
jgi:hypothetical protein